MSAPDYKAEALAWRRWWGVTKWPLGEVGRLVQSNEAAERGAGVSGGHAGEYEQATNAAAPDSTDPDTRSAVTAVTTADSTAPMALPNGSIGPRPPSTSEAERLRAVVEALETITPREVAQHHWEDIAVPGEDLRWDEIGEPWRYNETNDAANWLATIRYLVRERAALAEGGKK